MLPHVSFKGEMEMPKTLLCLSLCLCLLCGVFAAQADDFAFSDYGMVTAEKAVLFSAPSANSGLLGSLSMTEIVKIVGQEQAEGVLWYRLEAQSGKIGYMVSQSLRVLSTQEAAALGLGSRGTGGEKPPAPTRAPKDAPVLRGGGKDYVTFGVYPHSQYGQVEPILWRVLSVHEGQLLLMSEYLLDARVYAYEELPAESADLTYPKSELYRFLNHDFIFRAFTTEEQFALLAYHHMGRAFALPVSALTHSAYGFASGEDSVDPLRTAAATPYAQAQGVYVDPASGLANYWIGTLSGPYVCMGHFTGTIGKARVTRENIGVRVSVLLNVDSLSIAEGSGTKHAPYRLTSNDGEG